MSRPTAENGGRAPAHEDRRRRDPISVMIVDDHAFFRHGLREILTEYGLNVVAEAGTGERAVEIAPRAAPDVVVMDLNMPGIGGIEAIRQLTARLPRMRVLALTVAAGEEAVVEAIMAGACGYLLKDAPPEEISSGVRAAFGGASLISPRIGAMLLDRLRAREEAAAADSEAELTDREMEVLRLLARGKDNTEIAEEIYVSPSTVKNHISNILAKLQIENRIQAAVYAAKRGLL